MGIPCITGLTLNDDVAYHKQLIEDDSLDVLVLLTCRRPDGALDIYNLRVEKGEYPADYKTLKRSFHN